MARSRKKQKNNVAVAIEKSDFDALIHYATQNRCKKNLFSFQDEFKNRPESDVATIISNLCKMVMNCMQKFLAENCSSPDADNCAIAGKLIQVAVDIAIATLQLNFHFDCHVEIAILLNGILPAVPKSQDGVKNSIAQYCEKLCLTNFSDKSEYFLFNVLPYLLEKTLGKRVFKADIRRIYALRGKLGKVMELKETPKTEMWELFKKCALSQTYLSILEGQKLIGLSMALNLDKLSEIHKVIMKVLPTVNIKLASSYGRVYFEAWCYCIKTSKPDIKHVMEITCLQDLIVAAIRGGRRPIHNIVRKILAQFHIHKKDQAVSKMLYCLYQPLLWRFLKNPDGLIRANASQLFLDIFPLEDPEVKVVATDLELNDQLLKLRDLLVDDFPIVRITTVIGICVSMSVNWEIYPEEMIKTYFRIIVNDLCQDSSTAEVRCAVVKGLKCLLENPLTMRCLISILPKMGGLFHDVCEDVRVAFCQLLLRVKTISAIKYFDVVPTPHLFARLQEDCHVVKKSISNLLSNSYFPKNEDPKVWLGRCLELMKTQRLSSRVFFSYAGNFVGMEGSVRFIIQSVRAVHFYVKTKSCPAATANFNICNKENISNIDDYMSSLEEAMGFNNMDVVSTVMEALVVMWLSLRIYVDKPDNKYYLKMLVSKIGDPLSDLCLFYKDTKAWESVFYVSSFLPPSSVPCLASLCFWKLKNLPPNAEPDEYMTLLECLCNQQQGFELLYLLKEWILVGLNGSNIPASTKKRRIKKGIENAPVDVSKPYLANKMLNFMIGHRTMQTAILNQAHLLKDLLYLLKDIELKLEQPSTREISEDDASFLSLLVYNIVRLSVLFHDEHVGNIQFLDETVRWVDQRLLKLLIFSTEITDPFNKLVFSICQNLSEVIADVIALGFCDPNDDIYLLFFENLLLSEMGYRFALLCTRFLYKYAASSMFLYLLDGDTVMLRNLIKFLCNILGIFSNDSLILCLPPEDNITFVLANAMQIVHSHFAVLNEPISQAFKCFLKNILDSVITVTSDIVNELVDDPFDKISFPTISTFFLTILNLKPKIVPTYIKCLTEMFISSNKDISLWIANWAVIYNILSKKDLTKPILRETNVLVYNLGKTIHEIYPRKKIPEKSNSEEPVESPQLQIFQRHCHAEFLKLKSCLISKISSLKNAKKQTH